MRKLFIALFLIPGIMAGGASGSGSDQLFTIAKEEIKAEPRKEGFDPGNFFRDRRDEMNLRIWDSFKEGILKGARMISGQQTESFSSKDLNVKSSDSEIINDLGLKPMELDSVLWAIAELIKKQPKGEPGDLLNNGYANLFYVRSGESVLVIGARWDSAGDEWRLGSCGLGELSGWSAGVRVFSRN
jgi:hypothetical protein